MLSCLLTFGIRDWDTGAWTNPTIPNLFAKTWWSTVNRSQPVSVARDTKKNRFSLGRPSPHQQIIEAKPLSRAERTSGLLSSNFSTASVDIRAFSKDWRSWHDRGQGYKNKLLLITHGPFWSGLSGPGKVKCWCPILRIPCTKAARHVIGFKPCNIFGQEMKGGAFSDRWTWRTAFHLHTSIGMTWETGKQKHRGLQ